MKSPIWNVLTGVVLLATVCVACLAGSVMLNPGMAPVMLRGPATLTAIVLPSDTPEPGRLPPTWTPTPLDGVVALVLTETPQPGAAQPLAGDPLQPGLRPSSTFLPTSTLAVLPSVTATRRGGDGGIGGGNCNVEYQDPEDNATKRAGETVSTRWTLKNTSSKTWDRNNVDLRLISSVGGQLHTGSGAYDMAYSAEPQAMIDVIIPMMAPTTSGTYTSNWALMEGSVPLCKFFVTIRVR